MARGRASGYESQRELILAQAAALFARQGYAGTSMNEVAKASGISKPALYHYVRDKQELAATIAQEHVARLEAVVHDVGRLKLDPEPRLRELILRFVAEYAHAQDAHRVLTEDVRYLDAEERARVLGAERRVVDAFADAVAAVRPGASAAALDKPLAMLLFGMINWMFTWIKPEGRLSYDDMAPVVCDLFFGGVGAVQLSQSGRRAHSTIVA
ncbi:MAG: TetR/AcrR family transcriptional regulator [Rhizobacter sp.]|nr:TetR/AcrR family transcriptional regulator [Rhizobacter sp.]